MSNLQSLEQRMDRVDYQVISDGKDKKIADLEAKLAEKQKLLEDSVDVHETEEKDIYKLRYELAGATETIEVLKQQLAEKEKEIEYQESMKILAVKNQNQKAIAELEKVKAEFVNKVSPVKLSYTDYVQEVYKTLNNQIEELKKEMK